MLYVSQFKSKKRKISVAEHSLIAGSWVVTSQYNRLFVQSHFVINLKWMVGGQGTTTTTTTTTIILIIIIIIILLLLLLLLIEIIITIITTYSFQFMEKLSSDTFYRWPMSHNVVFNRALHKN